MDHVIASSIGWQLGDLKGLDVDLRLTGFGEIELVKLQLGTDDDGDADEAPEPPVDPISRPGDLWICGEHRVLCGDATVRADVDRLKPVALVERAIRNSSKSRDIVLDPFGGSGTTMIAAERTGRRARLLELDPGYCDVVVQRWQETTGGRASHAASGQSFEAA